MESSESVLKEISQSLKKPKPTVKNSVKKHVRYDALKVKNFVLQEAVPALFDAFKIVDQQRNEKDLLMKFDGLSMNVKELIHKFATNLQKIDSVQKGLQEKINRFDVLEAKYKLMIDRVNDVLEELERVLTQM